nr:phage holin family protein [Desulfuromonas sp. TF]
MTSASSLCINALILIMASGVIGGFFVRGFWTAVLGSVIISVVSALLTTLIGDRGSFEVIQLNKKDDRWE